MNAADPRLRPISKKRYCIVVDNAGCKIDVYPFWRDHAILEIESDSETEFHVPDFVEVVSDITGDERFFNRSLAKALPEIE